jgi:hypothetical protein
MSMTVEIRNLDQIIRRLEPRQLTRPFRDFLNRAGITVSNKAKERARVGPTGLMRATTTHELDSRNPPLFAKIGSKPFYAPYQEYGTGIYAEGPVPTTGRLKTGGITPNRFLRGGLEESKRDIDRFLSRLQADLKKQIEG